MLNKYLNNKTVHIINNASSWEEAIEIVANPLIKNGIIEQEYIEAIYETHKNLGPYYVLAPGIAMPHARPEQGSNGIGLSLLVIKEGVEFGSIENDPVFIVVMLAAKDSDSHIEVISALSEMFDNDGDIEIIKSGNFEKIMNVIKKY